jgi:hypothetical protein
MDLYSLFEFLGKIVNPLHHYSEFKAKIADPLKNNGRQKLAFARLSVRPMPFSFLSFRRRS